MEAIVFLLGNLNSKMPKTIKPKRVKKIASPKVIDLPYTAFVKIFGKIYTAQGGTAKEAISNLDIGKVAKGAAVMTVSKGERTYSKILNGPQMMRLFSPSRIMKEVAMKNVSMIFDF